MVIAPPPPSIPSTALGASPRFPIDGSFNKTTPTIIHEATPNVSGGRRGNEKAPAAARVEKESRLPREPRGRIRKGGGGEGDIHSREKEKKGRRKGGALPWESYVPWKNEGKMARRTTREPVYNSWR